MGYFFLDDSKHPKEGFFLSSFVFCSRDPQKDIEQILLSHNLQPTKDEFKSSAPMNQKSVNVNFAVRQDLKKYLHSCKVGVAISAAESDLYRDSCSLLQKMLGHPDVGNNEHSIFIDQGIAPSAAERYAFLSLSRAERCQFNFEQDSKAICGIQLADLSAHICAIMMKDSLGLVTKTVRLGEKSGYDSDIELGFEMFHTIRHSFLGVHATNRSEEWEHPLQGYLLVSDYGLHISESLSDTLKAAAESRFNSLSLRCTR